MSTSRTRDLPGGLEGVRRRFERWRRTHRPRSRIPDTLWAAAVRAASTCGVHRASKALRLGYYSLKDRVEQQSTAAPDRVEGAAAATFVELDPPAGQGFAAMPVGRCECTLELEDASGAKMRVHLKTFQPPDLAILSRSFWNPAP